MRTLVAALALVIALSGAAHADQKDTRLGPLFSRLKATRDAREGARITRDIWTIWFESDRPAVKELMERGQVQLHLSRVDIAAELFSHVIRIAPDFAEGWNRRATVRYLKGDYEGSLRDIEHTLKLEPRHFGALSGRGLVLVKLGRERAALAAFRAALAVNPHLESARVNIRILQKKLGEKAI